MEQENFNTGAQKQPQAPKEHGKGSLIGGIILITLGILFLLDRFLPRIDFGDLWPVILIVAGILLLRNQIFKQKQE